MENMLCAKLAVAKGKEEKQRSEIYAMSLLEYMQHSVFASHKHERDQRGLTPF